MITIPRRPRQRPTAAINAKYEADLDAFCAAILEVRSTLNFAVSSRGWCYILEDHGLVKGDFDYAQILINDCRKSGQLPLDICAEDGARTSGDPEHLDNRLGEPIDEYARGIVEDIKDRHRWYTPFSFWDDQQFYVEMVVEKIDLKSLFSYVCHDYRIRITNSKGWSDINQRASMMRRFAKWERRGKTPVLLYCGDHDPAGLNISRWMKSNMDDLSHAVGWKTTNLIIERFGLNHDFIVEHNLTWIDNLETGNGKYPLNDPRHPDHRKDYVQEYLQKFGVRKVEANSLVVRPEAGRKLCREAINKYLPADTLQEYREKLRVPREELRCAILYALGDSE